MKTVLILFLALLSSLSSFADIFPAERYRKEKVTWLGLDFTMASFINNKAFTSAELIVTSYIPQWNNIIFKEKRKYDVKKFLHKRDLVINIEMTDHFNSNIAPEKIVLDKNHSIEPSIIYEDSRKYASSMTEGLGIVMYVESFNKVTLLGIYRLVIIDLETGVVLFSEKILQKPSGFGVKNFWLASFYNSLKYLDKKMSYWGIA